MITLTTKDADFVANVIRSELQKFTEAYEEHIKEMEQMRKYADEIALKTNETQNKEYLKIVEDYPELVKSITEAFNKRKSEYEKIIELMMVGSNNG